MLSNKNFVSYSHLIVGVSAIATVYIKSNCNTLNGANGEWTGSDDVNATRAAKQGKRRANIVNKGQGGKSKVSKAPEALPEDKKAAKVVVAKDNALPKLSKVAETEPVGKIEVVVPDVDGAENQAEDGNADVLTAKKQLEEDMKAARERRDNTEAMKAHVDGYVHSDMSYLESSFDSAAHEPCYMHDPHAAPFCGLTAIDISVRVKPNARDYAKLAGESNPDPIGTVGTANYLAAYAAHRGRNLAVFDAREQLIFYYQTNPLYPWVHLVYLHDGQMLRNNHIEELWESTGAAGHYLLCVRNKGTDPKNPLATLPITRFKKKWFGDMKTLAVCAVASLVIWHPFVSVPLLVKGGVSLIAPAKAAVISGKTASFLSSVLPSPCLVDPIKIAIQTCLVAKPSMDARKTFKVGDSYVSKNDRDHRNVVDRRETSIVEDSYTTVHVSKEYTVFGKTFTPSSRLPLGLGFNEGIRYWLGERTYTVSNARFNEVYQEMQKLASLNLKRTDALLTLGRLREVNTTVNQNMVLHQTAQLLKELAELDWELDVVTSVNLVGLVALNAPNDRAILPRMEDIDFNQIVGGKSILGSLDFQRPHIKKFKLTEEPIKDKPVRVAPIGTFLTDKGPLGPGAISVTDSYGILASFAGRAMSRKVDLDLDDRFIDFAHSAIDILEYCLDGTDLSGFSQPDVVDYYREHYKGKKANKIIERDIADFKRYEEGSMGTEELRRYRQNSIFVKDESNVKKDKDGKLRPRPRGIFTMNKEMSMELSCCAELFHAWNGGPFGKMQVKGMDVAEAAKKVFNMQDHDHCVTDMSAFESSITARFRMLENFVIRKLMEKAGYHRALRAFHKHVHEVRELKTRYGTMYMSTRNSGDPWTSFGNGIVNVCLSWYGAKQKGYSMVEFMHNMLAEGDDGLIKADMMDVDLTKSLGFDLSSELRGSMPGDTDFLQKRYVGDRVFVNIGRSFKVLWVNGCRFRKSKQLYLLKCACMSLHNLCPKHPILFELINRVGRLATGVTWFKGADKIIKAWGNDYQVPDIRSYPRDITEKDISDDDRRLVAEGAAGFPPISVAEQLALEKRIREDDVMYLGTLLNDYDSIKDNAGYTQESGKVAYDDTYFKELLSLKSVGAVVTKTRNPRYGKGKATKDRAVSDRETWADKPTC